MVKNSKIYDGKVIHRRFKPKEHFFKYNVFSLLVDLDELEIMGHTIKYDKGVFGGYQAIMKTNNVYFGASESRKDGQASGY